ncbi:MAG: Lrp/AsnC family transcriptional regulator [Gemmatimonadota bacterium]|nr:Lrp/AsnC family transcriptional regulator [Gemmatimonadota bacterium]MDH3476993.1 Lrp/AsnC family transcriptional regulator [Gemmatimonadota bacterium]MDH3568938.1 Lrp/AsnC family transcriptional regulator [Gemmatimonadota bacterium]MDH5548719.1 Lrp/AsnC family transcriptional regulator [Gemmatimonadota bacterium]
MDRIDRQLLSLLQADARLGYQELGEAVGLSGPAVFQRVRKLEVAGILAGYHAAVNPAGVGRPLVAFLRVLPGPNTDVERLIAQWRDGAGVQECHLVTGRGGYLVKLRVTEPRELEAHLAALRRVGCEASAELALVSAFERSTVTVV